MLSLERRRRKPSLLACLGALLASAAIGLSAYAAHGVADPLVQSRLSTAAMYAFAHGLALAALGPRSQGLLGHAALWLLLLGTALFSGSLVGGALWHLSTQLAPVGGICLMAGWLLWALDALRR